MAFTSLEEFEIPFPNGVFFPGKSVNDILYIWQPTSLISNAVTKKRKILEIHDRVEDVEGVEDIHSQSGSEYLQHLRHLRHDHGFRGFFAFWLQHWR